MHHSYYSPDPLLIAKVLPILVVDRRQKISTKVRSYPWGCWVGFNLVSFLLFCYLVYVEMDNIFLYIKSEKILFTGRRVLPLTWGVAPCNSTPLWEGEHCSRHRGLGPCKNGREHLWVHKQIITFYVYHHQLHQTLPKIHQFHHSFRKQRPTNQKGKGKNKNKYGRWCSVKTSTKN